MHQYPEIPGIQHPNIPTSQHPNIPTKIRRRKDILKTLWFSTCDVYKTYFRRLNDTTNVFKSSERLAPNVLKMFLCWAHYIQTENVVITKHFCVKNDVI